MTISYGALGKYLDRIDFPAALHTVASGIRQITRPELERLIDLGLVFAVGTYSRIRRIYLIGDLDDAWDQMRTMTWRQTEGQMQLPQEVLRRMVASRRTVYRQVLDSPQRRCWVWQHKSTCLKRQ